MLRATGQPRAACRLSNTIQLRNVSYAVGNVSYAVRNVSCTVRNVGYALGNVGYVAGYVNGTVETLVTPWETLAALRDTLIAPWKRWLHRGIGCEGR